MECHSTIFLELASVRVHIILYSIACHAYKLEKTTNVYGEFQFFGIFKNIFIYYYT